MTRTDFINTTARAYIDSFIEAGTVLTTDEWQEWINKDNTENGTGFSEQEIGWIVDELEENGLVKENTMKYIVIDTKGADTFEKAFATKEEAIKYARNEWNSLTDSDKSKRSAFYVLESVDPEDENGHFYDGDIILDLKGGE